MNYAEHYQKQTHLHVYPVEFVVRALLGKFRPLKQERYDGKAALDLGFGDGRNMPLLHNLGMRVFGVEISQAICDQTAERMRTLGVDATLAVGRNDCIPLPDAAFDLVLACHSCYYVDPGKRFADNIREIARVLKPGGKFIFSVGLGSSHIFKGAVDDGDGHLIVTQDAYGVREGVTLKKFDSAAQIESELPQFGAFSIGTCRNDFWGIEEHLWIVVCRKIVNAP